jgi:ABC-type nitrate/sulfonate/bicarbonate transport system ATPase subunit
MQYDTTHEEVHVNKATDLAQAVVQEQEDEKSPLRGQPQDLEVQEPDDIPEFSSLHQSFAIQWCHVDFSVKDRKSNGMKHILRNVSGKANPGEVLAIMGPSGAGKSTLLDLIAGKIKQTGGMVLFNGKRRTRDLRFVSTYVQQQDHLLSTLTTRETIEYAARLQLPHSMLSRSQVRQRVEQVIGHFGLERCAETKIGNTVFRGVSGGEKRRVSIASEMVSDPQIVFLDGKFCKYDLILIEFWSLNRTNFWIG